MEPDGRVGFVDWQTVAVGPWVHDVNYFLVSALDVPDRRAHERELLGHYLKALASFGVSAPGTGPGVEPTTGRRSTASWAGGDPDSGSRPR